MPHHAPTLLRRWLVTLWLFFSLFLLLPLQAAVAAPNLQVKVSDALSAAPLVGLEVTAWYKKDGKIQWGGAKKADATGGVAFDLPALSAGMPVQLSATAFNNFRAVSDWITAPGTVNFALGETWVQVLDGTRTGTPALVATTIHVREVLADGSSVWFGRGDSDAQGVLRLNLPAGRNFVLMAQDKLFARYRTSAPLQSGGKVIFKVGSQPLYVTLKDDKSGLPLPNVAVTGYQLLADGQYQWRGWVISNAQGMATLDLPELETGGKVELRAAAYSSFTARSHVISQPGTTEWRLGTSRIQVVDGGLASQPPLANQRVFVRERLAGGGTVWFANAWTDAKGWLQLDLPGLASGRRFLLETLSPQTNSYQSSALLETAGESRFVVGSIPVVATLKDARSGAVLPAVDVVAWQIKADGSRQWRGQRKTDAAGKVVFDLPELNTVGAVIRLQAQVFNGFPSLSAVITRSGAVDFPVGAVKLLVQDGTALGQKSLPNLAVHLNEQLADGRLQWVAKGVTDAAGQMRLDLPDAGRSYVLSAQSPVTGRYRNSQVISGAGDYRFLVGTRLLHVHLFNALTGAALVGKSVTAYKLDADGVNRWKGWTTASDTNAAGQVALDSESFSVAGNQFVLLATPYNGGRTESPVLVAGTYAAEFPVGAVPATLRDRDAGTALANLTVHAYEIGADGRLSWKKQGVTDSQGQIQFDLEGVSAARRHVLMVQNPFGVVRRYYSQVITQIGAVDFAISPREDGSKLDVQLPVIDILSPGKTDVGITGFTLSGRAQDNTGVRQMTAGLQSVSGTQALTLNFNALTGEWSAPVPAGLLQVGGTVGITVSAWDMSGNRTDKLASFRVIEDKALPVITVKSHQDGDRVVKTGFILKGVASDDTGIQSVRAVMQDAAGGVMLDKPLDVTSSGDWALVVPNGQLVADSRIQLTLTAVDAVGGSSRVALGLQVTGAAAEERQLVNRITFGASPALLDEVRKMGADAFLAAQLNPASIDDSVFDAQVADLDLFTNEDLQTYTLVHMVHSRRQLREVMTWFWDNHFNTNIDKTGNQLLYELAENDVFRANALGNFRNLLMASAQSPAMLHYLDNVANVSSNANENYARELLELHTVGVDGGYTQREVEVLAEIFTGWQVRNDQFYFNAAEHNASNKVFWGQAIQGGGVSEGERALDILAHHPATARYICSKLVTLFVSDQPVSGLVQRCADTFLHAADQPDQIAQVLRTLLTAPEFYAEANFNSKFRTPLEFGVAAVRAVAVEGDLLDLAAEVKRMGISLYRNPVPTGWSETGDDWISTGLLQERIRFVNRLVAGGIGGANLDPVVFFRSRGAVTADSVAAEAFDLLMNNHYSPVEWDTALGILNAEGAFDMEASNANARLRELLATLLSYPACNYQ